MSGDEILSEDKVQSVLATALHRLMDKLSEGRSNSCIAIGLVHSTINKSSHTVETWLIKFDTNAGAFGIDRITTDKYPDGTLLYWHDDKGDAATQAALFGDSLTDN